MSDNIELENNNNDIDIRYIKQKDVKSKLLSLINDINSLFEIFKGNKHTFLYKLMIELFNEPKNVLDYKQIDDLIIKNNIYMIKYGKNIIKFDYIKYLVI